MRPLVESIVKRDAPNVWKSAMVVAETFGELTTNIPPAVGFVPIFARLVTARAVEVLYVVVPNCTESCAIDDDALIAIPTVEVGVRNWFGAVPESWKVTPFEPPQAEPDDEMIPPVDWRQPVPTDVSERMPATFKLVEVAFVDTSAVVVAFVATVFDAVSEAMVDEAPRRVAKLVVPVSDALFANTSAPLPVSSERSAAISAEVSSEVDEIFSANCLKSAARRIPESVVEDTVGMLKVWVVPAEVKPNPALFDEVAKV